MTRVLIRLARRLASWEGDRPVSEIQQLEFRHRETAEPDLRPSVYEIDDTAEVVCRVCAEHVAAVPLNPARESMGIFSDSPGHPVVQKDGSRKFDFLKTRHREIELPDEASLADFIALLKDRVAYAMTRTATRAQMVAYAKGRVEVKDREWLAVIKEPDTKDWLRKLAPDGKPT